MSAQEEMFPETSPDAAAAQVVARATPRGADPTPGGVPAQRRPGWVLVSSTQGPQGYHRVMSVGQNGSLVTVCGRVGRKVPDDQRMIVECHVCSQ